MKAGRRISQTVTSAPLAPGRVILHDERRGCWLKLSQPTRVLQADRLEEVREVLRAVEHAVEQEGLIAAGFVCYEAATAMDPAMRTHPRPEDGLPLAWFGLFSSVRPMTLPELSIPGASSPAQDRWQPSVTRSEYWRAIKEIKRRIQEGETYQVNYTYRLAALNREDPWQLFLRLAAAQQPLYGAFIEVGSWTVASASPELLFRKEGSLIVSRPMKGTRARGMTLSHDRSQATALRQSEKDRAENVMIVDMVRNDLGRIARPGTVVADPLFALERYPTVWQMTSTVTAHTDASLDAIFAALFPAASITGAPKVRTMELIAGLETAPRGIYTGAIGFVEPRGRAQFNVAIRTAVIDRHSDRAEYGVGGGVVWDSDPALEWDECRAKSRVLQTWLPDFQILETLLWTPAGGFTMGSEHRQRMKASADYFGYPFSEAGWQDALNVAARNWEPIPRRVRVLLHTSGEFKIESVPLPGSAKARLRLGVSAKAVSSQNVFLYHKTTHRAVYLDALQSCPGADDVLLWNERGELTESTIGNLVVELDGRLWTPPVECGLLAGVMRTVLLRQHRIHERVLHLKDIARSPNIFLINSVRGFISVDGPFLKCHLASISR